MAGRFQGPGTDTTMQWDLILFWTRTALHRVFVWARDWTRAEKEKGKLKKSPGRFVMGASPGHDELSSKRWMTLNGV